MNLTPYVLAQKLSGKTYAYLLPILTKLRAEKSNSPDEMAMADQTRQPQLHRSSINRFNRTGLRHAIPPTGEFLNPHACGHRTAVRAIGTGVHWRPGRARAENHPVGQGSHAVVRLL